MKPARLANVTQEMGKTAPSARKRATQRWVRCTVLDDRRPQPADIHLTLPTKITVSV